MRRVTDHGSVKISMESDAGFGRANAPRSQKEEASGWSTAEMCEMCHLEMRPAMGLD